MRIQLVSTRKYADYVLRRFTLTKRSINVGGSKGNSKGGNQQNRQTSDNEICREIVQFQYLKWAEYLNGAITPSWLLCFIGKINEYVYDNNSNDQISSGPLLIHCEDGCGRSGTFVAIRALMSYIQFNKYQNNLDDSQSSTLNVFDCVSKLRHQRYMAVDSVTHYILIYRSCLEYIKFGVDDLNDDFVEQHIKLNTSNYYPNRLSFGIDSNPNDIVAINYHNITKSGSTAGILPEFDV